MKNERPGNDCAKEWSAITSRDFREWKGLPESCGYSDFDSAFTRLTDAHGAGHLGSTPSPALFRMYVSAGYEMNIKVWYRDDELVLIDIEFPWTLTCSKS